MHSINILNHFYINKHTYDFYLLFGNKLCLKSNDELEIRKLTEKDINNFVASKDIFYMTDETTKDLLEFLKAKVDNYDILNDSEFIKKGRLVNYKKDNQLYLCIILDIKYYVKNNKNIIFSVLLLNQNGDIFELNQYIYDLLRPTIHDTEIMVDQILEILFYYSNIEKYIN